ncbi:hypothetical protein OG539_07805 [Actinacidiphila glaucinigra]|uniref:hypothetical protein n=1 Tax=Actinacidiphila glaucinigra TaxID=235986 RepID=UPI002DDB63BC|nr:hypothetical protein [Actinacidiphila glaucinigra]WSD63734.1 hypothetical protein OIE69_35010 [Actinacidiphila glaucinigra]
MPSSGVGPARRSRDAVSDGRPPSSVDRAVTALSCWWLTTLPVLLTPVIAHKLGFPHVRDDFGRFFGTAALISAVLAPLLGFVVALVARRRRARGRFVVMGAVSGVPVLFFWVFGVLLAECPDGYHC